MVTKSYKKTGVEKFIKTGLHRINGRVRLPSSVYFDARAFDAKHLIVPQRRAAGLTGQCAQQSLILRTICVYHLHARHMGSDN